VEKSDTNLTNVLTKKEMEEAKITFQKHRGEMLRQKMMKVEDP
jgi:hypothetical protein